MSTYTLKELSVDLDISIGSLRKYVNQGVLRASKVGRSYIVTSADLDKFLEHTTKIPMRNFLCQHYETCLKDAARINITFDCENCQRLSYGKERYEILLVKSDYPRTSL